MRRCSPSHNIWYLTPHLHNSYLECSLTLCLINVGESCSRINLALVSDFEHTFSLWEQQCYIKNVQGVCSLCPPCPVTRSTWCLPMELWALPSTHIKKTTLGGVGLINCSQKKAEFNQHKSWNHFTISPPHVSTLVIISSPLICLSPAKPYDIYSRNQVYQLVVNEGFLTGDISVVWRWFTEMGLYLIIV